MSNPSTFIEDQPSQTGHVSVKVSPFYRNNSVAWFRQLESQFLLAGCKRADTKFHHLVSRLPEDIATLALTDDMEENYITLKQNVLTLVQKSKQQRINEILSTSDLGGDKPSIFLRKLKSKIEQCQLSTDDELLKTQLLRCLPEQFRLPLSGFSNQSPEQLAEIADTMMTLQTSNKINTVKAHPSSFTSQSSHQQSTSIPYGLRPFHSSQLPKICRSHLFYGRQAKFCKPWCHFPHTADHQPRVLQNNGRTPRTSRDSSPNRSSNAGGQQAAGNDQALS